MTYTRVAFREWLESLPDKPFCEDNVCPINQFTGSKLSAVEADSDLAEAIDVLCHQQMHEPWNVLTPSDVLGLINDMDSVNEGLNRD